MSSIIFWLPQVLMNVVVLCFAFSKYEKGLARRLFAQDSFPVTHIRLVFYTNEGMLLMIL